MRSDKPYRRGWCTECLKEWQRARRAILKQEAEAALATGAIGLLNENPDLFDRQRNTFCGSKEVELYWTRLMMLKSGIYSAITMPPTQAPMTAMRMGSIMLVMEATAASTSWS